jgi:threonine synthase
MRWDVRGHGGVIQAARSPSATAPKVRSAHTWPGCGAPEEAIVDAVRRLAGYGYLAEPASAVALAGLWALPPADQPAPGRPIVLILTSSGAKWPEPTAEIFPGQPLRSLAELTERIAATA